MTIVWFYPQFWLSVLGPTTVLDKWKKIPEAFRSISGYTCLFSFVKDKDMDKDIFEQLC